MGAKRRRVFSSRQSRLGPRGPRLSINLQRLHVAQVEDDAALCRAVHAVTAAANRQVEPGAAHAADRLADIVGILRADDRRRATIHTTREHHAQLVITGIIRLDDATIWCRAKISNERGSMLNRHERSLGFSVHSS